ncbi:hypothetical protein [Virgibacillus ainsalahensis]
MNSVIEMTVNTGVASALMMNEAINRMMEIRVEPRRVRRSSLCSNAEDERLLFAVRTYKIFLLHKSN